MVVDYITPVAIGAPNDLTECAAPFNLTDNSSVILNGTSNPISFYHSLADAQQLASPILNPTNYNGTDGETIFVAVENNNNDCIISISSLDLIKLFYKYIIAILIIFIIIVISSISLLFRRFRNPL